MVCGVFTKSKIPDSKVDAVVQHYKDNVPAPISVTKEKQADGTWTVVATWPPCPTDVEHKTG